jgi:hypothetical protein
VHYSTAQLERSSVERFAAHVEQLLGDVAAVAALPPTDASAGLSERDVAAVLSRLGGDRDGAP